MWGFLNGGPRLYDCTLTLLVLRLRVLGLDEEAVHHVCLAGWIWILETFVLAGDGVSDGHEDLRN
jgi:hypothetical protein